MIKLLKLNPDTITNETYNDQVEIVPSLDVEELLATELSEDVKEVLRIIQHVIRNRRTFRGRVKSDNRNMVGLIPQHAKKSDLEGGLVSIVLPR
jgi:DNA polymerase III gamma/tau subunit